MHEIDEHEKASGDFETLFKCPSCGYVVSELVLLYARFDYLCAHCQTKHFSEFEATHYPKNHPGIY